MQTYRSIFDKHGDLVLARSRRAHEAIAASLGREGAAPLTLGVQQMRNCCGGASVKQQNLERMLSAIRGAAEAGVQMLYPWPYETESFAEPGFEARAVVFRTRHATVGVANCFDGEFPESVRRMRLAGAEVLLWCNAALGDKAHGHSNRINYSGAYAQANNLWVACCNCLAENAYGTSVIMSRTGEPLVVLPTDEEALGGGNRGPRPHQNLGAVAVTNRPGRLPVTEDGTDAVPRMMWQRRRRCARCSGRWWSRRASA